MTAFIEKRGTEKNKNCESFEEGNAVSIWALKQLSWTASLRQLCRHQTEVMREENKPQQQAEYKTKIVIEYSCVCIQSAKQQYKNTFVAFVATKKENLDLFPTE